MQEIGYAFDVMRHDMRGKLGSYMVSLQSRYGDPRVYEMQREEMARQEAGVIYSQTKTAEQALSSTYNTKRDTLRESHTARMNRHKTQGKFPRSTAQSRQKR